MHPSCRALMVCVLLVGPLSAAAQPVYYQVSGHVAEALGCTGDRAGVLVALEPLGLTTTTGADGTFRFPAVPAGDYAVIVSPAGSNRRRARGSVKGLNRGFVSEPRRQPVAPRFPL